MKHCLFLAILLWSAVLSAQTAEFVGVWEVDSSAFVRDGVQGTTEAPIIPVTWNFLTNGTYLLSNGNISGRYSLVADSVRITLNGTTTSMDYRVLEISDRHIVLHSTIYRTDDHSLETISYLSRQKEVKSPPLNVTEHE